MRTYIGTKIVTAEPMTATQFNFAVRPLVTGIAIGTMDDVDGYKVVYDDGYVSWSPKAVFERCYREVTLQETNLVLAQDWPIGGPR